MIRGTNVVKRIKVSLSNGAGFANFSLPDTIPSAVYRVRGYTQWMRNDSSLFFFDRPLEVVNPGKGEVFAFTSFLFSDSTKHPVVAADVRLTDRLGSPLTFREVKSQISYGSKKVSSSSLQTDINGHLKIGFPASKLSASRGKLDLDITLANGKNLIKQIDVPFLQDSLSLEFFPESGHMLAGVPNRVAFKAVGADGLGRNLTGTVEDADGAVVAKLDSTYLGMGSFFIAPEANKAYFAHILLANGHRQSFKLPGAETNGFSMVVDTRDSDKVAVKIISANERLDGRALTLVAHRNGQAFFYSSFVPNAQVSSLQIATDSISSGIVTLTLLDAGGLPIADRLFFVEHASDRIAMVIEGLKPDYTVHEKVDVSLKLAKWNAFRNGSFSVSVANSEAGEYGSSNILSNMLLRSGIRGNIEKPGTYFSPSFKSRRLWLDMLLLTQGWSRIDWKKLDTVPMPVFLPKKDLAVTGSVKRGGQPVIGGKLVLLKTGKKMEILESITDSLGRFSFRPIYADTASFVLQARTEKGKKMVDIQVDAVGPPADTKPSFFGNGGEMDSIAVSYLKKNNQIPFLRDKKAIQLREVEIVKRRRDPILQDIMSKGLYKVHGFGEQDFSGYSDVVDFLVKNVGVGIQWIQIPSSGKFVLSLPPSVNFKGGATNYEVNVVGVFINGVQLQDRADLQSLPLFQVKNIDVYFASGRPSSCCVIIKMKDDSEEWANINGYSPGIVPCTWLVIRWPGPSIRQGTT